jgi:hypothetical protein
LSMMPTKLQRDVTKYRLELATTNTIATASTAGTTHYVDICCMQIYNTSTANATQRGLSLVATVDADITVSRCILNVNPAGNGTSARVGFSVTLSGTVKTATIANCVIVPSAACATGSLGIAVTGTTVLNVYENTIYGWPVPINRANTAALTVVNNALIGNGTVVNSVAYVEKDYNVYDIDESETNGFLTTQSDAELFTDVSGDILTWDWLRNIGSDLTDKGKTLAAPLNVDFLGTARPQGAAFDCGAGERIAPAKKRAGGGHSVTIGVGITL